MIATLQLLVGYLVFVRAVQRHQPAPLAQFDCNENCATMLGGGRGCGRCLHLTLRGFECGNPNLIGKATLTASWNLRNAAPLSSCPGLYRASTSLQSRFT